MIYVVLGMHKSGTTLVAQTLHKSGVCMGFDLSEDDLGYATEKAESRMARCINREILSSKEQYSLDVLELASMDLSEEITAGIQSFIARQTAHTKDWGFKDPRTVISYPLWKRQLPAHKLIIVHRALPFVWRHYAKKHLTLSRFLRPKGIRAGVKAIRAWTVYNRKLLEYKTSYRKDCFCCDYEDLMSDSAILEALGKFVGFDMVDEREGASSVLSVWETFVFRMHRWFYVIRYGADILKQVESLRHEFEPSSN